MGWVAYIKPEFRNMGHSWGLAYDLLYGDCPPLGGWAVWSRSTGKVSAVFPYDKQGLAAHRAKRHSEPAGYNKTFNPFEVDAVA